MDETVQPFLRDRRMSFVPGHWKADAKRPVLWADIWINVSGKLGTVLFSIATLLYERADTFYLLSIIGAGRPLSLAYSP